LEILLEDGIYIVSCMGFSGPEMTYFIVQR